jgi:uncharacterized protein (TIGR02271 family)
MAKTIVGVFDDATSAQNAVRELQTAGVAPNHIRLTSNTEATEASRTTTTTTTTSGSQSDTGWTDRVVNFFGSLFEDEGDKRHASTYAEAWRRGHYLVVADVEATHVDRAVEILNRFGTVDIDRRAEHWKKSGYTGSYDASAAPYTAEQRTRELAEYGKERSNVAPVVQEELVVGKHVVQRGGVRIHSYVQERPVEERVRLREEHINVERRPVNRPVQPGDVAFKERTVDVTAQGEEAVAQKRARVVEEVVVGKDVSEREETVRDTVRRKDVDVERVEGNGVRTADKTVTVQTAPNTQR